MGAGGGLGHPDRQEGQGSIRLTHDQMVGAGVTLGANHSDALAAARVERIGDPRLKRRTPGTLTLVRPVPARPGSPSASPML
jgi:hypothetical protein